MPDPTEGPPTLKIKVCGLTSVENALACVEAGADWIGLNFHAPSTRYIDPSKATEIVAGLPPGADAVGLFVDRPVGEIQKIASLTGLKIVQLHGREPIEYVGQLAPLRVVRAYRLGDRADVERMIEDLKKAERLGYPPDAVLIDAFVPGREGGTGHPIPSAILDALPAIVRLILAGGLTPENVAERVDRVHPWMVDVASGVESTPGVKDPARVRRFVHEARSILSTPG